VKAGEVCRVAIEDEIGEGIIDVDQMLARLKA
jgi:hypothetical protein